MSKLRTYGVIFTDKRFMRVELEARSPKAAIAKAERLYLHGEPNDPRFEVWGGDAFYDAEADEV
jgi:hypothetical protein